MRAIGSQNRETLKEANTVLIKMKGDMALTINNHGQFELWAMHNHVSGYCLEIDGVGYEFYRSADSKMVFNFLNSIKVVQGE